MGYAFINIAGKGTQIEIHPHIEQEKVLLNKLSADSRDVPNLTDEEIDLLQTMYGRGRKNHFETPTNKTSD